MTHHLDLRVVRELLGSNILLERFECYLRGGRIGGMVRIDSRLRDSTPLVVFSLWMDVPYRLFFAHSRIELHGGGRRVRRRHEPLTDAPHRVQAVPNHPGAVQRRAGAGEWRWGPARRVSRADWGHVLASGRLIRDEASSLAATGPDEVMHAGTTGTTGPPAESRAPGGAVARPAPARRSGVKARAVVLTAHAHVDELSGFRSGDIR